LIYPQNPNFQIEQIIDQISDSPKLIFLKKKDKYQIKKLNKFSNQVVNLA
jgi:hypothetical protein